MKKILSITLITILLIGRANAFLPLPPPPGPGGYIVDSMRAQEDLRRQQLENQMMQQRIYMMMQQQQAMLEMQRREEAIQQNQVYNSIDQSVDHTSYNDKKISDSLENNALGQSTHWWDPSTGIKYSITPKNNTTYRGNQNCRAYRLIIQSNKKKKQLNNLACRLANGSWIRIEKR